jgi:hypothetical protein
VLELVEVDLSVLKLVESTVDDVQKLCETDLLARSSKALNAALSDLEEAQHQAACQGMDPDSPATLFTRTE